ncbi:hypothetical protein L7F22_034577 [Adiantum nelumboides]|nr:hypothetical protein [Adiantum nelumboides]
MVATANNSVNVVADALSLYDFGGRKASEEEEMEEEEEAPTHINTKRSLQFLVVSVDKLSAKYTGEGQHANDVGAFQGNRPAPVRRILYYFEIYIKDRGNKGTISIGFTDEHFKTSRQPGWDQNTYGYHGDDGYLYHAHGRGDPFGPTFHTGDTVGAGINYASQEIFFTVNGKLVGSRHKDEKCPLYPSVGLHSASERIDINFGQNPFVFNIEALVQEEREKLQREIETLHLPLSISHSVARSYLLHYGYQETLQAFDAASGSMVPPVILNTQENGDKMLEEECYALEHRRKLRQLIRNGDINGTLASLESWYPHLLKSPRQQVVKTPSRASSSKGFVAFGRDTVNDDKGKAHVVEQPPASIGHKQPSTHGLVNGRDSNEQVMRQTIPMHMLYVGCFGGSSIFEAMIRPSPALHGFMPDNDYGAMQAGTSNPMYGNISVQPGFQCAGGSYGMLGANMRMAGFSKS